MSMMDVFKKLGAAAKFPRSTRPGAEIREAAERSLVGGRMAMEFTSRYGKDPDISRRALVRKYWGWVHACASITAQRVAASPIKLYAARGKGDAKIKRFRTRPVSCHKSVWLQSTVKGSKVTAKADEYEEILEHPLLDLLSTFNDSQNGYDSKELTDVMLSLSGDAYWLLDMNKALGIPQRAFILRSQWVKVLPDRDNFIRSYIYGADPGSMADRLEIDPAHIIHFMIPNPHDPWYGLGPVQAAAYACESAQLRENFVIATMGNMGRPDLIIKYVEGELDPRERAAVEREWNGLYQGVKNVGKVKVTDYRWELEKVGWSPSELDFTKGEEWILKKICAAFAVPQGLIDMSNISNAPAAGVTGADMFMAKYNTMPRCTRLAEKLNERLCPMYDERLFLAFEDVVPADRTLQLTEDTQRLTSGYTFINELRERDGLPPVKWGDQPLSLQQGPSLGGAPGSDGAPGTEDETEDADGSSASDRPGNSSDDKEDDEDDGDKGWWKGEHREAVTKALDPAALAAEGMTLEVDGSLVHPDLAGRPVRLAKVRRLPDTSGRQPTVKGEEDGHPFRGNQYTRGESGGASPDEAAAFIKPKVQGQTHGRHEPEPMLDHLRAVAGNVGDDPTLQTIALLHDSREDNGVTDEELRTKFGPRVADAVAALTWDEAGGERYEDYIKRVAQNPDATLVKLADLRVNMTDLRSGVSRTRAHEYTQAQIQLGLAVNPSIPYSPWAGKYGGTGKHKLTNEEHDKKINDTWMKSELRRQELERAGKLGVPVAPDVKALYDSKQDHSILHHIGPDGKLTPEREAYHQALIDKTLDGATASANPTYTVLGGGMGAGKSTLVGSGKAGISPDAVLLDVDQYKTGSPEFRALVQAGNKSPSSYVHEEYSVLSSRIQREIISRRASYVQDGCGDTSIEKLSGKIAKAQAAGYRVEGVYVTVPTNVAIDRMTRRAMGDGPNHGRFIPLSAMYEVHSGVSQVYPKMGNLFDSSKLFDVTASREGVLVASSTKAAGFTVHDPALWEGFLSKANETYDGGK